MDWVTIISTIGFPCAACIAMAFYVKYTTDENNKRIDSLNESHKDEIQKITEALNNNTLAIQKLIDKLGN